MNGEPPKKGTNVWLWIGCGCGLFIAVAVAIMLVIVTAVFGAIRSSDPYKAGVERARADARVQEALGAPVEPGWIVGGSIQTQNRSGDCDLTIPLKGAKQNGVLRVIGTKDDGQWTYTKMSVKPASGPPIDLLR